MVFVAAFCTQVLDELLRVQEIKNQTPCQALRANDFAARQSPSSDKGFNVQPGIIKLLFGRLFIFLLGCLHEKRLYINQSS